MLRNLLIIILFPLALSFVKVQKQQYLIELVKAAKSNNKALIEQYWGILLQKGQPVVWDDSVAFVYRGEAKSVIWNGDFNSWGKSKAFQNKGTRLGKSDIWILKAKFPADARLDYKIVVDGKWIVDPHNEHQQWSGVSNGEPNSELRMKNWNPSPWTKNTATKKGQLTNSITLQSNSLGYPVNVQYYTPNGYEKLQNLPSVYVTDGQEYSDHKLGAMIEILDNLIEQQKIEPIIAVFIDPRDVKNNSVNRRAEELTLNPKFASFITDELVPFTDSSYKTSTENNDRAILGTSLGGLNATYLGVVAPNIFGKVAIQSPAYWYKQEIMNLVANSEGFPNKVSITTGVINDTSEEARKMKRLIEEKPQTQLQYIEVNEGHSWGNWRALIDDQLIFLFPLK
ncbi:MAG TPA: alpha/beta hydrolase-fold protein [Fulvivirga sp.]|nr:alpha/beta hydrolase-fold protein [Fulvivirga sp.]